MEKICYARVYPWGVGSLMTKLPHTEICGVAEIDWLRNIPKVKVGSSWLSLYGNECKFQEISKAEFDTDLAFELWPRLRVKYCPRLLWWFMDKNYAVWKKTVRWGIW